MGFIFYGLVQFITDILNFLVVDKMLLINKQRSKGVELKSKHFEIETPEQSTDWVNKFDEWDAETARIIKRFDPAYAEYFKYIDTYKMTSPTTKGFDEKQQRKINALKEKLARIEKYYEQERNR